MFVDRIKYTHAHAAYSIEFLALLQTAAHSLTMLMEWEDLSETKN